MKRYLPFLFALFFAVSSVTAQRITPNKPILFKATSTECNVCGLWAWDDMKEAIRLYEKDAVIIAVHPLEESLLHSPTSTALMENNTQFFGTPTFFVNNERMPFQLWLGDAGDRIEAFQERQVVAHPFVDYVIEGGQLKVEVKTQYLKRAIRPHHIAAYVIEDQIEEFQNNRGPEDLHSKIMRTHLGEEVFGTLLSPDNIEANQEFTHRYTLDLDPEWNPDNLEVAVIIWERAGDRYEIINANVADEPTALSTSINILEANEVSLQVQPTIVNNIATVQLNLPIALDQLSVTVVNALGQNVKNVFSGNLTKGNHTFLLNRSDYSTDGLYFLVIEKDGDRLVEKMILK